MALNIRIGRAQAPPDTPRETEGGRSPPRAPQKARELRDLLHRLMARAQSEDRQKPTNAEDIGERVRMHKLRKSIVDCVRGKPRRERHLLPRGHPTADPYHHQNDYEDLPRSSIAGRTSARLLDRYDAKPRKRTLHANRARGDPREPKTRRVSSPPVNDFAVVRYAGPPRTWVMRTHGWISRKRKHHGTDNSDER